MPRLAGYSERVHQPLYPTVKVTDRQREVLYTLREMDEAWLRPMDIGASDCSHHSRTLRQLVQKGLVEKTLRGGHTRAAYAYRATKRGRDLRLALRVGR